MAKKTRIINGIPVVIDTGSITMDSTDSQSKPYDENLPVTGTNLGIGAGIYAGVNSNRSDNFEFRSLVAGSGISLETDASSIVITATNHVSQGPKGDKGDKGDIGNTGPQGEVGPQGPTGLTGPPGIQGIQGTNGTSGAQGIQGIQGPIGLTGGVGPAGPQGIQGNQGIAGVAGPIGLTGPQGPIGAQGIKGDKGDTGSVGPAGTNGIDGAIGPQGEKGDSGLDGAAGPQGIQGLVGPAGLTGPQGMKGDKGDKGDTGDRGTDGSIGPQGPIGLTGPQGIPGTASAAGADGATGPQGPIGLTGPKGDTGDAGADGAIGPQGPAGIKGDTGDVGPQGPQGIQGPQGDAGIAGADGAIGPQGPKGDTGDTGPQGIQGIKGDTGDAGPQGLAGADGADGAIGPQGLKGDTGDSGTSGLPNVENKSSAMIRDELTAGNVIAALTYTPYNATNPNNYITALTAPVTSVDGFTGDITKEQLAIENLDNTSDANKPVSTAQALADTAVLNSAKSYADGLVVGLWDDRGNYNATSNTFPATGGSGASGAILKGDAWTISDAGTLGGVAVLPMQTIRALVDSPDQTSVNWAISTGAAANSDQLVEGSTNKFFTEGRVLDSTLTGLSLASSTAITSSDNVLGAVGKIQKQITDLTTTVGGKQPTLVSNTNIKTVNGVDLLGSGDLKVGYANVPPNPRNENYTIVKSDSGLNIRHPHTDPTPRTYTIDSNANQNWVDGTVITFQNKNGAGVITIAVTTDTMRLAGVGTTGSRTLSANGVATAIWDAIALDWTISGTGLT